MARVAKEHLLTAVQMATFVTEGYLALPEVVPPELNEVVYADMLAHNKGGYRFWLDSQNIRDVFELAPVKGAIQSLVGENPGYDHSFVHITGAGHLKGQTYHADSIIDKRPLAFDIQAFYFPRDTPDEMGPTLIVPGSHLRRVNTSSIGRYKNVLGQKRLACKAGTIVIMHHGIWHCAQPNQTEMTRYMFKLRLRPGEEQRNLFNTDGCRSEEVTNLIYRGYQPWQGNEARLDHVNRAALWRYVVGNDSIDVSFEGAFTRMGI